MSLALAIPLLLLLASCLVVVGPDHTLYTRTKLAAYPVSAAFVGAIVILWLVATEGPITFRFYDPTSIASLAFPIGFYIDRLSAVMMTLITGVSTVIYCYSIGYMYQDCHFRRYLALICFTDFVLICMVSSANLMMLFLFWQGLSYLLYLLAHNHAHAATLRGAFKTFTLLRVADVAFLAGIVLAYQLYGTLEFHDLFARAAGNPVTLSLWAGLEISATTAV
ncbi:MAG: NADH-quinone oxidoreductase subunit L, partial [Nitrospiraceae bacterium]